MGFGMMGSCCCGGGTVMVVLSHSRYDTGGGVYANLTAYDGTSNSSGTLLWKYDLGLADAGAPTNWQSGQPRIDADGNVYVASFGITGYNAGGSGVHEYTGRLTKLDSSGAFVWDYFSESFQSSDITLPTIAGDSTTRGACCAIMDDGNIVFGHPIETTSTYFMSIIDPAGSLVSGIPYPGGSIPTMTAPALSAPISVLDVDSSGNIYFTPYLSSLVGFTKNVYKVDSSGTYIATFAGTPQISAIRIDRTNGKLYAGAYQSSVTWASGNAALQQADCSTMTADWTQSLTDIAGTASTSQSSCLANTVSISPNGDFVYSTITARNSGGTFIVQVFASDANTGTKGIDWSQTPATSFLPQFNAIACDPVTGDLFATQSIGLLTDRIWKLDHAANGVTLWHTLGSVSATFRSIDARSV